MNITISIANISNGNGTERAVTNLANLLVKYYDYRVTILSIFSKKTDKPYFDLEPQVQVVHLEQSLSSIISRQKAYYFMNREIKKLCKIEDVNIAIGTDYGNNIAIAKLPKRIKKICCAHLNYDSVTGYGRFFRKIWYKKADAVVLLTNADASHYTFLRDNQKFVIPNSLSFMTDLTADMTKKRIICVGRLNYQKGFDILIENGQKLRDKIPDWKIDIYGSGDEKDKLLKLIEKNNLNEFIEIHEPVKEIQEELLSSSLYLMTSRYEGLPMVLLEAKSCGLPIVAFDCPEGPADVIKNNEDGYMVPLYDVDALFEKVELLANNIEQRKQFSKKAKENSLEFSTENIAKKWNSILKILMENN